MSSRSLTPNRDRIEHLLPAQAAAPVDRRTAVNINAAAGAHVHLHFHQHGDNVGAGGDLMGDDGSASDWSEANLIADHIDHTLGIRTRAPSGPLAKPGAWGDARAAGVFRLPAARISRSLQ
jgi:hypothetical protein